MKPGQKEKPERHPCGPEDRTDSPGECKSSATSADSDNPEQLSMLKPCQPPWHL